MSCVRFFFRRSVLRPNVPRCRDDFFDTSVSVAFVIDISSGCGFTAFGFSRRPFRVATIHVSGVVINAILSRANGATGSRWCKFQARLPSSFCSQHSRLLDDAVIAATRADASYTVPLLSASECRECSYTHSSHDRN